MAIRVKMFQTVILIEILSKTVIIAIGKIILIQKGLKKEHKADVILPLLNIEKVDNDAFWFPL